jgi:hypothetical protein
MGSYETRYETKDGKTRRVNDVPAAPHGAREPAAAPKKEPGADTSQAPGKPAKEGV